MAQHVRPVFSGVGMKVVGKNNFASPNPADLVISFGILDQNIPLLPFLVSISAPVLNAWFNDWHIVVVLDDFGHPIQRELFLVNGECFEVFHIIDV